MTIETRVRPHKGVQVTSYRVRYYDETGKRREKEFTDEAEARRFERNPLGAIAKGAVKVRRSTATIAKKHESLHFPKNPTVDQAFEVWIRLKERGTDGDPPPEQYTLDNYAGYYRNHMKAELGDEVVTGITAREAKEFRDQLVGKLSRPMAKKVVQVARQIFGACVDDLVIPANPFLGLKIKTATREKIKRKAPEPSEFRKVLDWIEHQKDHGHRKDRKTYRRYDIVIRLFALAGLRSSELRGLRWPSVKLEENKIEVVERADRKQKKLGAPKSAAGTRKIYISDDLVKDLREWKLACPPSELDLVIPTHAGTMERGENLLKRAWQAPQKKAGVTKVNAKGKLVAKYTAHELRHFFASLRIGGGYSGKELQEEIGHSSIATTMDIYGHLFEEDAERRKKKVQEIENEVFGGKPKTAGGKPSK